MTKACPYKVGCIDDASSFGNFSSESPDEYLFKSIYYKNQIWDGYQSPYTACLGFCTSSVSQEAADLCALNNAAICEGNKQFVNSAQTCSQTCPDGTVSTYTVAAGTFLADSQSQADAMAYEFACEYVGIICTGTYPGSPGSTVPTNPVPVFNPPSTPPPATPKVGNDTQTCSTVCPSGSTFTYVVPGSYVYGVNQADANARALSLACQRAALFRACFLSTLPTAYCKDVAVNEYILLDTIGPAPYSWYEFGTLPSGLGWTFFGDTAYLTGTPTSGGAFTTGVVVYDANGHYTSQSWNIRVMDITTAAALPDATEGTAYAQTIAVAAGSYVAPLSFQLEGTSTLPDGLILDSFTGSITGTPTTPGDYTFTIVVQDEAT